MAARLTVPAGVSMVSSGFNGLQSADEAANSIEQMLLALGASGGSMVAGALAFINSLAAGTQVEVRLITLTTDSDCLDSPISMSGSTRAAVAEVVIIDARFLPAGAVLQLDDLEFAAIAGEVTITGGAGDNVLIADGNAQSIELGDDDDILIGGEGDDIVGSSGGNDQIFGGEGDDIVYGGSGINTLHGGTGLDTARYQAAMSDYLVTQASGSTTVQSLLELSTVDTLINVERIGFSDQTLEIDDAAISLVVTLYQNILGRQANVAGITFWGDKLQEGVALGEIAMQFLLSPEFTAGLQTGFSDLATAEQVDTLYQGLLNRDADVEGKLYWMEVMDKGSSMQDVAAAFVGSAEFSSHQTDTTAWSFSI